MEQNLVIQLGEAKDVIATLALIEKVKSAEPQASIWLIVFRELQDLVDNNPAIDKIICWDSDENDFSNLKKISIELKKVKFNNLFNASTSLNASILTFRAKAKNKTGFKKSGLSAFLNYKVSLKKLSANKNKVEQILELLNDNVEYFIPSLHIKKGEGINSEEPYFLIAPMPDEALRNYKYLIWEKLLERLPQKYPVYVICNDERIIGTLKKFHSNIHFISDPLSYARMATIVGNAHKVFSTQNIISFMAATAKVSYSVGVAQINYEEEYDLEPEKTVIYNNTAGRNDAIALYPAKVLQNDLNYKYKEQEKMTIALQTLRDGGIIVHETDTIPGLAVNSINSLAVESLYRIKERDPLKSMLILCSDMRMVKDYVHKIPSIVFDLIDATGEYPLTIIYPHAKNLPENLMAKDGSIGIRVPQSEKLQFLIARHGFPIVSTSANISGEPAPSDMEHLQENLISKVDMILDIPFKEKESTMASTIIKLEGDKIEVIRIGMANDKLKSLLEKSK